MSKNVVLIEGPPESISTIDRKMNEEISEEEIADFMLDHDYIVKIRPVKEYKIRVKVISIEKALPRIIEPEGIDEN